MFIQSTELVKAKRGDISRINVYGQEKEPATYRLAKMNLVLRGISHNLGDRAESTFTNDLHRGLYFNYIMAIIWSQLTQRQSGSPFEAWMAHTKIA